MDKVLITGADGFFASRFIDYYKNIYDVIGLNHEELDITDEYAVIAAIEKHQPAFVIHTAAISDTGICEKSEDLSYAVNVKGSVNIAKGCLCSNTKLIFLSSDQIYNGNIEAGPYNEECVVSPNNVYGKHKLQAENELLNILPQAIILRLTWLFGLPEKQKKTNANIVCRLLRSALKNEAVKLPVYEFRGITYVYDIVENFNDFFALPGGVYNAGSENDKSTFEIAELIFEKLGLHDRTKELLIKDIERYKIKSRDLRICTDKLKKQSINLNNTQEGIEKCLSDFSIKI
jgi:dTDP-4-dehydrorhamnose reductase